MISVAEARALILAEARSFGKERLALEKSVGRILAQDAVADRDYPPFNRSAMDGYAVVAEDFTQDKKYQIVGTIFAGDASTPSPGLSPFSLRRRGRGAEGGVGAEAVTIKIMTGAAVPTPFDAVIRKEDALAQGDTVKFNLENLKPWHNISRQGEDVKRGQKIAVRGRSVDNATMSLLASLGVVRPLVARLPSVAIISTGNEVIDPAQKPKPVQIRNSNALALRAQLAAFNIHKVSTVHIADEKARLAAAIRRLGKHDILLLTGGVSAGDSDYVPEVLTQLKFRKIFHKVQIKPGKPLWFGVKGKTTVFAIPGNPLSAQVIFKVFIEPFLRKSLGMEAMPVIRMPLTAARRKKDGLENYFPVRLETHAPAASTLSPVPFNGSGDIRAALFSDGLAAHPAELAELKAGEVVDFFPWGRL